MSSREQLAVALAERKTALDATRDQRDLSREQIAKIDRTYAAALRAQHRFDRVELAKQALLDATEAVGHAEAMTLAAVFLSHDLKSLDEDLREDD